MPAGFRRRKDESQSSSAVNVAPAPDADFPADDFPPNQDLSGVAVALVEENGQLTYRLCGCLPNQHAKQFLGFLVSQGEGGVVSTGVGSIVTPVVEGGVALTVGERVFLSETAGEVTQTPPDTVNTALVLYVGVAVSSTQIALRYYTGIF